MASMPHSSYGIVKALGEKYTISLGGVIAKFWNIYGIEKNLEKYKDMIVPNASFRVTDLYRE